MKIKRPWNRINNSIFSVSTVGTKKNMNICTYVTPISMKPKLFAVAIYYNTLTYDQAKKRLLLQLLGNDQFNLINKLGKQSGKNKDKLKGIPLGTYKEFAYIKNCCALFELEVISKIPTGDHELLICKLVSAKNISNKKPLQLEDIIKKKIIL